MLYTAGILLFVVLLMISVALHEGGHAVIGRLLKMKIPKFFVGFGPTLFSRKIGKTEYGIKAIPAGGFVEIEPSPKDDPQLNHSLPDSSDGRRSFTTDQLKSDREFRRAMLSHVAPWKRILVFLAGPAVNIVLGIILLTAAFWVTPVMQAQPVIAAVNTCEDSSGSCNAEKAGLMPGDRITKVDDVSTPTAESIASAIKPNSDYKLTVINTGEERVVPVTANSNGQIGIDFTTVETNRTFPQAVARTGMIFTTSIEALADIPDRFSNTASILFGGERTDETLGSVLSAGNTFGTTASDNLLTPELKAKTFLAYTGLFNLSLGLINLLPLMPLDGGRIALAIVDSIRNNIRKLTKKRALPLSTRLTQSLTAGTAAVVFACLAVIVIADIIAPAGV